MPQGAWMGLTATTSEELFIDAGAVRFNYVNALAPGTLLCATRDGNRFVLERTIREVEIDSTLGPTKGLRRRSRVVAQIVCNMANLTVDSLRKAIAGSDATAYDRRTVQNEYVLEGDGINVAFPCNNGDIIQHTLHVWIGTTALPPVLQIEGAGDDYTVDYVTGIITFNAGSTPAVGEHVMVDYDYDGGAAATDTVITGRAIAVGDFVGNVALVGTISGKGDPVVCIIKNALPDAGLTLATAPHNEVVPEVVFTGHFDPADPHTEPWELRYPAA